MPAAHVAAPEPVQFVDVAVPGGVLSVAVAGAKALGRAPLILLHGWTLDHRMWRPQIAGLGQEYFLVMPDRRGCGRTAAPPDLGREADDVIAIADALELDRFALAGLSQGASVALDVARQYPHRLNAVVVSGTPLPGLVARDEPIDLDRYAALAAAGDMAALRADWARHPLMQAHAPAACDLLALMLADYDGRDLLAPSDPPELSGAVLGALGVPVLAVTGEHDTPWRRACAKALAAVVPRAMYGLVPGAGHLANADNPERFNAMLGAFLRNAAAQLSSPLQTRPNP